MKLCHIELIVAMSVYKLLLLFLLLLLRVY